jgi:succinate dehydrogenase/fumarate reductase flavoprotein subunit
MRAAIEAFDAGTDVALISKIHPTHSHSDAAEGRIDAALGNGSCGGESVDYLSSPGTSSR